MSAGWVGLLVGCWVVAMFLLACLLGLILGFNDRPSSRPRARERVEAWGAEDDVMRERHERTRAL